MPVKIIDRDRGFRRIVATFNKQKRGSGVVVGIFEGAKNPDSDTPFSVAQYGGVHEFGEPSVNIPQRSFMRSTFDEQKRKYVTRVAKLQGKVIDGKIGIRQMLNKLGILVQGDIKKKLTRGPFIPLSPATIESRKFRAEAAGGSKFSTKPLIDTGTLRNSIIFETRIGRSKKRSQK